MELLWSRSFLNTISFLGLKEDKALVGTTFGFSVLDANTGRRIISKATWKRVQSLDFWEDKYVVGQSFPGSIMWFEEKDPLWIYRTTGSVNAVLHFGSHIIAGTGFLTDIKGARHVYVSPYYVDDKWREMKGKLRGVLYSISRDLNIRWRKEVQGIVGDLIRISQDLVLVRMVYNKIGTIRSSNGEWISLREFEEPIRAATTSDNEVFLITRNNLMKASLPDLEVLGQIRTYKPFALATSPRYVCLTEGKNVLKCYEKDSLKLVWKKMLTQNIRGLKFVTDDGLIAITAKERHGKILLISPKGEILEERKISRVPIYISGYGSKFLVGTLSKVFAFECS